VSQPGDRIATDPMPTSLLFDVLALNQSVGRLLESVMTDGPLRPADYAVYSAVFELEAASPTAIAERLGIPLTTAVDRLREVEGRGHAGRLPNPADGRSHLVVLTAAGLAAHAVAARRFEIAQRAVIDALPSSEVETRAWLAHVRAAIERALAVSPPRLDDRVR
jgi:DNA-binding MarR family transcriptional regulator